MNYKICDTLNEDVSETAGVENIILPENLNVNNFQNFSKSFSGKSFNNYLYRIHSQDTMRLTQEAVDLMFPEFESTLKIFAYDWLGRQYAFDMERFNEEGENLLAVLQVEDAQVFAIDETLQSFHETFLNSENGLHVLGKPFRESLSEDYKNLNLEPLECIAFKTPLFLNAEVSESNLEVQDLIFYWKKTATLKKLIEAI